MGDRGKNPYRAIRAARETEATAKREARLAGVPEPNKYELVIMAAENSRHTPEINLHGYTAQNARGALEKFLDEQYPTPTEVVRIIHGKGTGALQNVVSEVLAEKQRERVIAYFRPGTSPRDAGAAFYAVFAD